MFERLDLPCHSDPDADRMPTTVHCLIAMELQGSRQASGRRFAIVVSSFNKEITDGLLRGARGRAG